MENTRAYLPHTVFAGEQDGITALPRAFISPQRYIQGNNILAGIGRYISLLKVRRVGILVSARGRQRQGECVVDSLRAAGLESLFSIFNGECSVDEIEAQAKVFEGEAIECVMAIGGGKCVDTGKAVAFRLGTPVIIAPTLASNDAPCSALSVLYSPQGSATGVEFYPDGPALVVVDTGIVAEAPERYLVSGMGDAMATWYEASVCLRNETAVTTIGARPTLASSAIGEICAQTLFSDGLAASAAVAKNLVNESLEKVVEANTLLSGLGFESGGLAAAHGIAQSYTAIPAVHTNFLHGEMVAMGTLTQLLMEARKEEAIRVAEFFISVGLPVHLDQLSLQASNKKAIETIVEGTLDFPFIQNMPMPVDAALIRAAVLAADETGKAMSDRLGDVAYRRLHRE